MRRLQRVCSPVVRHPPVPLTATSVRAGSLASKDNNDSADPVGRPVRLTYTLSFRPALAPEGTLLLLSGDRSPNALLLFSFASRVVKERGTPQSKRRSPIATKVPTSPFYRSPHQEWSGILFLIIRVKLHFL
jgi:hypothetical protein